MRMPAPAGWLAGQHHERLAGSGTPDLRLRRMAQRGPLTRQFCAQLHGASLRPQCSSTALGLVRPCHCSALVACSPQRLPTHSRLGKPSLASQQNLCSQNRQQTTCYAYAHLASVKGNGPAPAYTTQQEMVFHMRPDKQRPVCSYAVSPTRRSVMLHKGRPDLLTCTSALPNQCSATDAAAAAGWLLSPLYSWAAT